MYLGRGKQGQKSLLSKLRCQNALYLVSLSFSSWLWNLHLCWQFPANSSVKCIVLLWCKKATKFSRNPRRDRKGERTALHFYKSLWECCLWIQVPMTVAKKQHVQSCELCLPFDRVNNKEETEFPCPKGAKTAKLIQLHQWGGQRVN